MKFDVGDTVLLLHSGEEGTIMEILDDETVSVNVKGTVFPVYTDQLDFPYFKRFRENRFKTVKQAPVRGEDLPVEKPGKTVREETGLFLSFLPEYDHSSEESLVQTLRIYLLNETSLPYLFHYRLLLNGMLEMEVKNVLHPFAHFYLNNLPFDELNDRPKFEFSFSLQEPDPARAGSYEKTWRPKAKQIIQQLNGLQEKQEATFSYLLFKTYPDKDIQQNTGWELPGLKKQVRYVSPAGVVISPPPQYEIDLHIEKLVGHYEQLTPADMLAVQLGELQRQLDLAIARRQFSLVVIHGVGKGTLRNEVHEILRITPEVRSFVNQYDVRYGYGATEVFFEYK